MSRRSRALVALVLLPLVACGAEGSQSAAGVGGVPPGVAEAEVNGVVIDGDGWTATFPGEVQTSSDPIPLPGGLGSTTAETILWESSDEAVSVVTSDFPPEIMEMVDARALLEGTAAGIDGTIADIAPPLGADGRFLGRDAVIYEAAQDAVVTNGLAFVDGARLYQILHVSRGGDPASWRALVDSFDFIE